MKILALMLITFKIFNFETREIDWQTYLEQYFMGTKKYLFKEDLLKIKKCQKDAKR